MFFALLLLLPLVCTSTRLALSKHDWRDKIVKAFRNMTKYINQVDTVKYRELFADDTEVLLPGMSVAYKEDLIFERFARNGYLKEYPVSHIYASFVEFLYSSPDVAIVRATEIAEFIDGMEHTAGGFDLFIRDENDVKIKLGIFTME